MAAPGAPPAPFGHVPGLGPVLPTKLALANIIAAANNLGIQQQLLATAHSQAGGGQTEDPLVQSLLGELLPHHLNINVNFPPFLDRCSRPQARRPYASGSMA